MANVGSFNLIGIGVILFLLYFPSFIQSVVNPIDFGKPPMWIDPCMTSGYKPVNKSALVKQIGWKEYYYSKRIKYESYRSLLQIKAGKDDWVYFNYQEFYFFTPDQLWKTYIYTEFLPKFSETHKLVDSPIPVTNYTDRFKTYQNLYIWLQKVGVGMEQMLHDQYLNEEPYLEKFIYAYKDLQVVLCEIETYFFAFGIQMEPDVDRGIMTDDERVFEVKRYRLTRDFAIIREYVNLMEFLYELADNAMFLQKDPLEKEPEGVEE